MKPSRRKIKWIFGIIMLKLNWNREISNSNCCSVFRENLRKSKQMSWKSANITTKSVKSNFLAFLILKTPKQLTKICWNIEVWAVQKHVNLLDLAKSFPTNIFLQNLASIQKRTSLIRFDYWLENQSKVRYRIFQPRCSRRRRRRHRRRPSRSWRRSRRWSRSTFRPSLRSQCRGERPLAAERSC